jgi:nucleoside-diphosphate-sugar epimerase
VTPCVLVTGANGFVGSALCRRLVQTGAAVRGLVRPNSDLSLLAGVPLEKVVGSLDDPASLARAAAGVELVFHVAAAVTDWGSLDSFRKVNVEGTRNLLEACARVGVRRLVYVSSVAVHSFIDACDMDEDSPQLPTPYPYCQTKREAEALVNEIFSQGKLETVIIRPGDLYGPGDRVVFQKMAGLLRLGLVPLVAGGRKLGAFTCVDNLVAGLLLAGGVPQAAGRTYVITDGTRISWRDYFAGLAKALGYPPPRLWVTSGLAQTLAAGLENLYLGLRIPGRPPLTRYLAAHLSSDFHFRCDRACRELGYAPQTDFPAALRRTARWYREILPA